MALAQVLDRSRCPGRLRPLARRAAARATDSAMIKRILIGLVALVVVALRRLHRRALRSCSATSSTTERAGCSTSSETTLTADTELVSIPSADGSVARRAGTSRRRRASRSSSISAATRRASRASTSASSVGPPTATASSPSTIAAFRARRARSPRPTSSPTALAAFDWLAGEGLSDRALGPLARLGPGDLGCQGARGRRAVPRDAVHLRGRGRRRPLRLRAGRAADARPVSRSTSGSRT